MAIKLKQSTASQEIPLGYFVDSTDGNTEEVSLTINNTDIKLWKMGATTLANKNSGGATHISNGIYYCTLDATDTNTLGALIIFVHVSGALAVRVECEVLPSVIYDTMIAGTDNFDVSVTQWSGSNVTPVSVAGVPEVDITHIGGVAVNTNLAQIGVNVIQISGDSNSADNLEAATDGTGYNVGNGSIVAASVTGAVGSVTGAVGSVTGAVGSVTSGVTVTTNNDKTGYALTSGERTSIAEALLKLDFSTVTGEAARSALNALRALRNKTSIAAGTMTVTKEDDSTTAWTAAVTTDAAANPITVVDPA